LGFDLVGGNQFFLGHSDVIDPASYPDNEFLSERPAGTQTFLRPNLYDPRRAHLVVYNWGLAEAVEVDLGEALSIGESFEIRNAQDYFSGPVLSTVYDGSTGSLAVTGLEPAMLAASDSIDPVEFTGWEFNVFVLLKTSLSQGGKTFIPLVVLD